MISAADIHHGKILIVDDKEANILLLERILRGAGYLFVSSTIFPQEVQELHRKHRYDLILLDLQMPGMDGFQVMQAIKGIEPDGYLPVIVITAQPDQKLRALQSGAKDFISKPFELSEVLARSNNMIEVSLLQKRLQNSNNILELRVQNRVAELRESYLETIYIMTRAAEHKDDDTGAHVQRISHYSRDFASLLGMGDVFIDEIFVASPMHDIGKIGIADHILLKPGGFLPDEWEIMKGHAAMGAKILGNSQSRYLKMGAEIALNHHERWDGGGYPNKLQGEDIPLAARIMNICDIYDALRSQRPYKPAFSHKKAMTIITQGDGRTEPEHFDPMILAAFAQNHGTFEAIFESQVP